MKRGTFVKGVIGAAATMLALVGIRADAYQGGGVATLDGGGEVQPQTSDAIPSPRPRALSAPQAVETAAPASINELFAEMAVDVQGFGGMFFEADGEILVVYVLDTDQARVAEIDAGLSRLVSDDAQFQQREIELRQGQYTFAELQEWYALMNDRVHAIPGVVFTDVDEAQNRLVIGVETAESGTVVEQAYAEANIPDSAVVIEVSGPITSDFSLRRRLRPPQGGVQIFGFDECTFGFSGKLDEFRGFVTAAHCTLVRGGTENTIFYQPGGGPGSKNRIGFEYADPEFISTLPGCPSGKTCRWSDSAFVVIDDGIGFPQGQIADAEKDDVAWFGDDLRIDQVNLNPLVGSPVSKVGKTTGQTHGNVTRACVDFDRADDETILCQTVADYDRAGGDSGAPVFFNPSPSPDLVTLYGVHWAGGGGEAVFSPMSGVQNDLGNLENLCVPGSTDPNCD